MRELEQHLEIADRARVGDGDGLGQRAGRAGVAADMVGDRRGGGVLVVGRLGAVGEGAAPEAGARSAGGDGAGGRRAAGAVGVGKREREVVEAEGLAVRDLADEQPVLGVGIKVEVSCVVSREAPLLPILQSISESAEQLGPVKRP